MHSVENEKFSLTKTIFREIKSVGTIGKTLLSRNFFQKSLKEYINVRSTQCGNYGILLPPRRTILSQKFRESNVFTKKLYSKLI